MKQKNSPKFKELLNIITYGIEFQRRFQENPDYMTGILETTGFIAACIIVENFGYKFCLSGTKIGEALKLDELPKREKIEKRLKKLFKNLKIKK